MVYQKTSKFMRLFFDYETRSTVDLETRGLDNYARHPSTAVLMCAYALDDGPVALWEAHTGPMPADLREPLEDPFVQKVAWNATFEHTISRYVLGLNIPHEEFLDPMIWSRHLSVPGHLEDACEVFGLPIGEAKIKEGKKLIQIFCVPASMGGEETLFGVSEPSFHDWNSKPAEWAQFCAYCKQDVVAERAILKKMERFPLPEREQRGWVLDQRINHRGMPLDLPLIAGATAVAETTKEKLRAELKQLTGVENTNSQKQMMAWLSERDYPFSGLAKGFVERAVKGEGGVSDEVIRALTLRRQASKTSDSKLDRIREMMSSDGRLRDQFKYLGSSRCGRWSGQGVQLHNLPRPTKAVEKNLTRAIELLTAGEYEAVKKEFENPLEVVASCLRSSFRAPKGYKFVIVDLNAIENRVLGWMAKSESILEVFRKGRCPYLSFCLTLFSEELANLGVWCYEEIDALYKQGVPIIKDFRQKGKPPILGAGYRLGGGDEEETKDGDIIRTGLWGYAQNMGVELTREEAHNAVSIWRAANPEVAGYVKDGDQWPTGGLWRDLEHAAFETMKTGEPIEAGRAVFQAFGPRADRKMLRITLPSGRGLHYIRPKIEMIPFMGRDKKTLTYEGIDLKTHKWGRIKTQGGKITENCLTGDTRVYTNNGFKRLDAVSTSDLLWDGLEWVSHSGVISKGTKEVGEWRGLKGTRDHQILVGPTWFELEKMDRVIEAGALLTGRALAPARSFPPSQGNGEEPFLFGLKVRCDTTWTRGNQSKNAWKPIGTAEVFDLMESGPRHRFMVETDRGPVIVHNCDQAISRDLLLEGLFRAEERGFEVVGHVHDEIIALVPVNSSLGVADLRACMIEPPAWGKSIPLDADGFEGDVYKKG